MSRSPRAVYAGGALAVAAVVVGVLAVGFSRSAETRSEAGRRRAAAEAGVRALVAPVTRGPAVRRLELQGEARPFATVTLYAKVSGYLKEIKADRGDKVRARQVLAVIESPELEQQYEAARADASYKRANARRAATLAGPGAVSVREAELEKTSADVAEAQVAALETQKGYTILRAPFAGTVTARFADPGALVQNAANAQSGALPVVTVSQLDRLRVFVYVDQRDAAFVHAGDQAEVALLDGGVVVAGRVARASGELEPHTRTMPIEIHLENQDGRIVAGSFVTVRLTLPSPPLLEIPARALVVREQKTLVAVVAPDNRLRLRPVVVARDDGDRIGLRQGVSEGELVALDVGHSLSEGDLIQPVPLPAPTVSHAPGK